MHPRFTFNKTERLNNRKLIRKLFACNDAFFLYPFRVIFLEMDHASPLFSKRYPAQVLFTVSKKRFKLAVARNRLKRLMREGYRKNKYALYDSLNANGKFLLVGFVYTAKSEVPYHEMEKKIKAAILRLTQELDHRKETDSNHTKP